MPVDYVKETAAASKRRSMALKQTFISLNHRDIWGIRRVSIFLIVPLLGAYSCMLASIQFTVSVLPEMYTLDPTTHSLNANFISLSAFKEALFSSTATVQVPVTGLTGLFCFLYVALGLVYLLWVPFKLLKWRDVLRPHLSKGYLARLYSSTLDVVRGKYFMHQYFVLQVISLLVQLNRLLMYGGYNVLAGENVPAQVPGLVNALGGLMAAHAIFIAYQTVQPDRIVASVASIPIAFLYTMLPLIFLNGSIAHISAWAQLRTENFLVFLATFGPLAGQISNIDALDTLTVREYALRRILLEKSGNHPEAAAVAGVEDDERPVDHMIDVDAIEENMAGFLNPDSIARVKRSVLKEQIKIMQNSKSDKLEVVNVVSAETPDEPLRKWAKRVLPASVFLATAALFLFLVLRAYFDPTCSTLYMWKKCAFKTHPLLGSPHCDCLMLEITDEDMCLSTTSISVPVAQTSANNKMTKILATIATTQHLWITSYKSFRPQDTSIICPNINGYDSLGELTDLISLQIDGGYRSTSPPSGIAKLSKLQIFRFTRALLAEVPAAWANLKQLKSVDLRYDFITSQGFPQPVASAMVSLPNMQLFATSFSPVCSDVTYIPQLLNTHKEFLCDTPSLVQALCQGGDPSNSACIGACRPVYFLLPLLDTQQNLLFSLQTMTAAGQLMGIPIAPTSYVPILQACAPVSLNSAGAPYAYISPAVMFVAGTQAASNCMQCPEAQPYYNAFNQWLSTHKS